MSLLPAALRHRLARLRLVASRAEAVAGPGDRRGKAVGAGVEFAEYQAYQPGEDARRIDPGVFLRLGQTVVRRQVPDQSLAITVLVDQTASMAVGDRRKALLARQLAAAMTYLGLQAGDRVRLGVFDGDGLSWSPAATAVRRVEPALRWLASRQAKGAISLEGLAQVVMRSSGPPGLTVLITDGWLSDGPQALRHWHGAGQELTCLLLAEAAELEPRRLLGSGAVRLQDAETGRSLEVVLDEATVERRRQAVVGWHGQWRRALTEGRSRLLVLPSEQSCERILLRDLVRAGMLA